MPQVKGGHRVDWKPQEQDRLYERVKELWADHVNHRCSLVELVRMSQDVLESNRRRNKLQSFTNVPKLLRERLLLEGIGRTKPVEAAGIRTVIDPNVQRISQLEEEKTVLEARIADLETSERDLQTEVHTLTLKLKAVPSESDVMKNFVADIFYLADAKKRAVPGATGLPQVLDSAPKPASLVREDTSVTMRKPKIVLVGGKPNTHAEIHRELKDLVDLRYFEAGKQGIGDSLKAFKSPAHGRVLVWTRVAAHQQEEGLKFHNIPFEKVDAAGTGALIAHIRKVAEGLRARVN